MTRYLTTQEVLFVQECVIEQTGGQPGVRDLHLLESTLNRPRATFGGSEVYPSLPLKGAVLVYSLVLNQLFVDGNRRTGLVCLDVFLRLNGLRLAASEDESYAFVMDVATETLSMQQIADWIAAHMEPEEVVAKPRRSARPRPTTSRRLTISVPLESPSAAGP